MIFKSTVGSRRWGSSYNRELGCVTTLWPALARVSRTKHTTSGRAEKPRTRLHLPHGPGLHPYLRMVQPAQQSAYF